MAKIYITDASHPLVGALAERLRAGGHEVALGNRFTSKEEVRAALASFGTPDLLLLSEHAGVNMPLDTDDAEPIARAVRENILSAFYAARHFGARMAEAGKGNILYLGSVLADHPSGGCPGYSLSQGAMQMNMRDLALYYGNMGLRVNMLKLSPAEEEDALFAGNTVSAFYDMEEKAPVKGRVQVDDLVGTIEYILSPAACLMNGSSLTLDGGLLHFYFARSYTPIREEELE